MKPEISLSSPGSSTLDTTYRAWVGDVELTGVKWDSATQLTAMVPAGLAVGTYGIKVQGPFGAEGSKEAAFQVREGRCPVGTAALVVSGPTAAPATLSVGQDVTVTATIQNNGLAAALGVAAAAVSAPSGFTLKTGPGAPQDVPPGQARTFSWTYTATAAGGGVFVIGASGTAADTGLPVTAPSANTNAVLASQGVFLTASTLVAPLRATIGQLVTVVLTVTNHAAAAAVATPAIAVSGPVTAGTTPSARSIPGGTSQVFQWTYTASAPGTATFTASVSAPDPGTGATVTVLTAPADVTVQVPPGLAATLTIPASIVPGDFTVTMQVNNSGGAAAADVANVVPDAPEVNAGSTASAVLKSGPTVTPPTDAPPVAVAGQPAIVFNWVFAATASGELSLSSIARGKDANTGAAIASPAARSGAAQVLLPTVGGTVSGLAGSGLVLHNGSDSLPISANGSFTFPTRVASGGSYAVTVATQPSGPSQTCTVANGSGTVGAASVTNVNVTCAASTFTVGGTVSGLAGTGLVLHSGSDSLPIAADGPYAFPTRVASGGSYAVTVTTQPSGPGQTCTVANGDGTVGGGNVTNVNVTCATSTFSVGGTVSGLSGTGLVLRNGSDSLPIPANGSFTFPTRVASGGSYAVTVTTQPSGPGQTCTVANGSGTVLGADVTNVNVTCATRTFTVGGTVSGLAGTGLRLHNGSDTLSISANGAYTFPTHVLSGATFAVTVTTQPSGPSQTCTVANGSGTVGGGNVTNANVTCATSTVTVGGRVSGLAGAGLVLHNGPDNLPISANGSYTFPSPVARGGTYAVSVATQPAGPSQTCTVANAAGTAGTKNVTNVNVTCATNSFTIGGTVSGLTGSGLVLRNGASNLPVAGVGPFAFQTKVLSGATYAVTVQTQPSGQTCSVAGGGDGRGGGTVGGENVTSIAVNCSP